MLDVRNGSGALMQEPCLASQPKGDVLVQQLLRDAVRCALRWVPPLKKVAQPGKTYVALVGKLLQMEGLEGGVIAGGLARFLRADAERVGGVVPKKERRGAVAGAREPLRHSLGAWLAA